jgi:hypothetical protein
MTDYYWLESWLKEADSAGLQTVYKLNLELWEHSDKTSKHLKATIDHMAAELQNRGLDTQ